MSTILIIEDDELIRSATTEFVGRLGHTTFSVGSVEEADKILTDNQVDLILLDILLPQKDGMTWFQEKQKAGLKTPVIFMSNFENDETMATAAILGAQQYLVKANTDLADMRAAIEKALQP